MRSRVQRLITLLCACVALGKAENPPMPGVAAAGKGVYDARCAYCHGSDGKGSGAVASVLNPRPRDLTTGSYRFRSTESGSLPTEADLIRTISRGLPGTSMPGMKGFLQEDEIRNVMLYVKSFSPRFTTERPKQVSTGVPVPLTASSLAAGKALYQKLECAGCHGSTGDGSDAIARDFVDENGLAVLPTDLTAPWSFHGGATATDVFLRLRTGIDGTPMPSYHENATDTELRHLANYVVSLARKPVWSMSAAELEAFYAGAASRRRLNPVEWGRQLVSTLGCRDCHSPVVAGGMVIPGYQLAGGQRWELYPFFNVLVTPNLTSDKETGLGNRTDEQLRDALTRGIRTDGSRMLPFPMPWTAYARLKDEDLKAVIAYLRTMPPVVNRISPRETPNIVSYFWGKFRMLILKQSEPGYIYYGNAGQEKGGAQ